MEQTCVLRHQWGVHYGEFGSMLDAQRTMPNAPTIPSNVGVILLSREKSLLFNEPRQLSFERQSQGRKSRR